MCIKFVILVAYDIFGFNASLMKQDIIYKSESYNIIGCAFEVHNELGSGFFEAVYQEALEIEFALRNIPSVPEHAFDISYKEHELSKRYIADFLCFNKIIIELKALPSLSSEHTAQVLNYLKCSGMRLGILINFGRKSLEYKRIVL